MRVQVLYTDSSIARVTHATMQVILAMVVRMTFIGGFTTLFGSSQSGTLCR